MRSDAAMAVAALLLAALGSGCGQLSELLIDEALAPARTRAAQHRTHAADALYEHQQEAAGEVAGERVGRDRVESDLVQAERALMRATCGAEAEEAREDALTRMRLAEQERGHFYLCTAAAQPLDRPPAELECVLGLASRTSGTIASCQAEGSARCGTEPPPLPTWPEVGREELAARGMSNPPPCFAAAHGARPQ